MVDAANPKMKLYDPLPVEGRGTRSVSLHSTGEDGKKSGRHVVLKVGTPIPLTDAEAKELLKQKAVVAHKSNVDEGGPGDQYTVSVANTAVGESAKSATPQPAPSTDSTASSWADIAKTSNATQLKEAIAEMDDPADVQGLLDAEKSGEARATVVSAAEKRLAELKSE